MKALIGCGTIGSVLQQHLTFDRVFDTKNIDTLGQWDFDEVYCAAPGANRIVANADPMRDQQNIQKLIQLISQTKIKKFILISTVDTVVKHTAYALNRKMFEDVVQTFKNSVIVRLPSLIGPQIKKNMLYDLKHGVYIDKINLDDVCQWYDLQNLVKDIAESTGTVNLVSEPIANSEIIQRFFPDSFSQVRPGQCSYYNLSPYRYTKQQIFDSIHEYCNS